MTQRKIRRIINWTNQEDLIIATSIINEVRDGSTLREAYETAAEKVNEAFGNGRTGDAIGFRWTSILKSNYVTAFEKAKADGKEVRKSKQLSPYDRKTTPITVTVATPAIKQADTDEVDEFIKKAPTNSVEQVEFENKAEQSHTVLPTTSAVTNIDVLNHIEGLKAFVENTSDLHLQISMLTSQLELSEDKNKKLEIKNSRLEKENSELKEDYNAILKVIERARKLTVTEESIQQEKLEANKFKMERNGNLSRI